MKKQKKPAQNNHEGCYIPGGMEMYADQPGDAANLLI